MNQSRTEIEDALDYGRAVEAEASKDAMDTLVAVLDAIGYTEDFAAQHPDMKVSEGVKLFLATHSAGAQEPVTQWQYRFFDGVKWVDWANCTELLVKHKDGRDDFQFRALFERAHPQPLPQTDNWPEVMSSVQDADGRVTSATLRAGEVTTRMVPAGGPQTDAARDALRTALRDAFNAGGHCTQERIPLTAGVYAESRVDKLFAEIERLERAKGE